MKSFRGVTKSCFDVNVQAISLYMIPTEPRKGHIIVSLSLFICAPELASHYHKIICHFHNLVSLGNRILSCGNEILSCGNN